MLALFTRQGRGALTTSTRTTRKAEWLLVALSASTLSGCLTEKDQGDDPAGSRIVQNNIGGSVGDGPLVGASISISSSSGDVLAELVSDSTADYSTTVTTAIGNYPLRIVATGGTDLVTSSGPDFDLLGAVPSSAFETTANVNPFSTLAVLIAEEADTFTANGLAAAEETVSNEFGFGLSSIAASGPMNTPVDESNISELVRASEGLGELIRRVRDAMLAAGYNIDGDYAARLLAADLVDGELDGVGSGLVDKRTSAIAVLAQSEIALELMANELHVNGSDATSLMRAAIMQILPGEPAVSLADLPATSGLLRQATRGLSAAASISDDPAIDDLLNDAQNIQVGMDAADAARVLPGDYRFRLDSFISQVAEGNTDLADLVLAGSPDSPPNPGNSAPTISGIPATSVVLGNAYSFDPVAADADGDSLTFSVSGLPSWASFDSSTGALDGIPSAADVGVHANIRISVSDGQQTSSLPAFSIQVFADNSTPVISGTPESQVSANESYSFVPTASDPDGDALTFSIAGLPVWAGFNPANGALSGTPSAGDVGVYAGITISVSDGGQSAALPTFSIEVLSPNSAPSISGSAPESVVVQDQYSFVPTASDPDGDTLTFSVTGLPAWANFNTSNGALTGTPEAGDVGVYSNIVVTVSDGLLTQSLSPFSIEVVAQGAATGSATLSWVAPTLNEDGSELTDLVGFRIYWGTTPGNYTNSVAVDGAGTTSTVISGLVPGTYEFVATAVNSSGVESAFSGTATKTIN